MRVFVGLIVLLMSAVLLGGCANDVQGDTAKANASEEKCVRETKRVYQPYGGGGGGSFVEVPTGKCREVSNEKNYSRKFELPRSAQLAHCPHLGKDEELRKFILMPRLGINQQIYGLNDEVVFDVGLYYAQITSAGIERVGKPLLENREVNLLNELSDKNWSMLGDAQRLNNFPHPIFASMPTKKDSYASIQFVVNGDGFAVPFNEMDRGGWFRWAQGRASPDNPSAYKFALISAPKRPYKEWATLISPEEEFVTRVHVSLRDLGIKRPGDYEVRVGYLSKLGWPDARLLKSLYNQKGNPKAYWLYLSCPTNGRYLSEPIVLKVYE
jgi:hypothetical protein